MEWPNLYHYAGEYTDNRGLPIPDKRIVELLKEVDKDEAEILNFLGKDLIETPGAAYHFLEMFAVQKRFYLGRQQ